MASISSILSPYFPFDSDVIADKLAKQRNTSAKAIQDEWKTQASISMGLTRYARDELAHCAKMAVRGKRLKHDEQIEYLQSLKPGPKVDPSTGEYYATAIETFRRLHKQYEIIDTGVTVADPLYGVAGTLDVLAKHRETGQLMACDWKATGQQESSFRYSPYDSPCNGSERSPLKHIPNSKFPRAALQTCLLVHMLRTAGYSKLYGPEVEGEIEIGVTTVQKGAAGGLVAAMRQVDASTLVPPDTSDLYTPSMMFDKILRSRSAEL